VAQGRRVLGAAAWIAQAGERHADHDHWPKMPQRRRAPDPERALLHRSASTTPVRKKVGGSIVRAQLAASATLHELAGGVRRLLRNEQVKGDKRFDLRIL
jgi:hypothetical protein